MKVTSTGISDGYIQDIYGKRGSHLNETGMPTYSLPLTIEEAPEGTKTFAIVLEDKDAYPVVGFSWIHWMVANLNRNELLENESITASDFVQGINSWASLQGGQTKESSCCYGGMTPPDADHVYDIHVYALDKRLDLHNGFMLNELHKQMEGHILEQTTLKGIYRR